MKSVDLAAVQKIIADIAATEIMPRFRALPPHAIMMKGVDDPVTLADQAAEKALIVQLTSFLPGSVVVGEEGVAEDPSIVSRLGGEQDVWVIDPIDGTRSFIEGIPEFGVMIALVRRQQTIAAWIHDPNTNDTLMAEQGEGVWLRGHKMRLAGHDPATPKLGLIGSRFRKLLERPDLASKLHDLPQLAAGSAAAFDYARLFAGDVTFANSEAPRATYLLYRGPAKPWDHVPGLCMLAEEDGYAADLTGRRYEPQQSKTGLLVTSDRASWDDVHLTFKPVFDALAAA